MNFTFQRWDEGEIGNANVMLMSFVVVIVEEEVNNFLEDKNAFFI